MLFGSRPLIRTLLTCLLAGQVLFRLLQGRLHWRNLLVHLYTVGPASLYAVLLVNGFAGMIFTVQTARELSRFGAIAGVGGAFALAFCRELSPVLTASVMTGQVGSAFAAEIGAMKISEQIDALRMLRTDPIDYLITPRIVACCLMLPVVAIVAMVVGIMGGIVAAALLYGQPPAVFLLSVRNFLTIDDLIAVTVKSCIFGAILSVIGCSCGLTTIGGAREVGQSATAAVVVGWICLFGCDFLLSLLLFGTVPTSR
uniref:MlaE family lipid ABC transporter permease subunit n=1 Tax=Oculatella sp. LEGE 06141 TaxID=1828648 RepID=UPI001D136920